MKRIILLCMFISASHLYGMSLDEKILSIKQLPISKQANLKEFTVIVAGITILFSDATREEIAIKFDTPIARRYIELNYSLIRALLVKDADWRLRYVQDALRRGADSNFTFKSGKLYKSVLGVAYEMAIKDHGEGIAVVELLLKNQANPNVKESSSTLPKFARKIAKTRCNEYNLLDLLQRYGGKI